MVNIPTTAIRAPGADRPGQSNNTSAFLPLQRHPATFIYANLNGTISAWNESGDERHAGSDDPPGPATQGLAIATNTLRGRSSTPTDAQGDHRRLRREVSPRTSASAPPARSSDPELPEWPGPVQRGVHQRRSLRHLRAGRHTGLRIDATPEGAGAVAAFDDQWAIPQPTRATARHPRAVGHRAGPGRASARSPATCSGRQPPSIDSVINAFDPSTGALPAAPSPTAERNQLLAGRIPGCGALSLRQRSQRRRPQHALLHRGIDGQTHGLFGSLQAIPPSRPGRRSCRTCPRALQTLTTVPANGDLELLRSRLRPQGLSPMGRSIPATSWSSNFNNSPPTSRGPARPSSTSRRTAANRPSSRTTTASGLTTGSGCPEERLRHRGQRPGDPCQ